MRIPISLFEKEGKGRKARYHPALLALLALSVTAWFGCSSPTSPKKTACACEKDKTSPTTVGTGLEKNDSLVKAAKAAGKGVITGALQGEGKDVVKGLLKTASNAAGERRYLSTAPVPLSGATILIFDALRPTTAAETTLTTDAKGNYAAVLKTGRYYGFAVHLDLATFRLITASIPFITPKKDTLVRLDTAIAIEDVTSPSVTSVYDATSPDASGLFLVGGIPAGNARVNIAFSEPVQRESVKGLVVGKVDEKNSSGSVQLKDSLAASAITASWSGDSKQLTLALGKLESGSRYGIIIPTSIKDLAKNPLEKEYRAVFEAVSDSKLADLGFTVSSTYPADKEAIKPTQNPSINFSQPPHIFSALNAIVMDPKVEGYWEVTGSKLSFVHKEPFQVGVTYKVAIPDTLVDLGGRKLGQIFRFEFTVKDYEGAAKDKKGRDQAVALLMEDFFNSYLQGDIGRLGSLLDPSFRMESGTQFLSQLQFLDKIRREVSEKNLLNAGFIAPVYKHDALSCSTKVALWKVASADKLDTLWVQSNAAPGILPKVFRIAQEITSGIAWSKTEAKFTLDGKAYVYNLAAAGGLENAVGDARFQGERLRQGTTAVLNPVKDVIKDEFTIDGGISVTETEAKVAVKVTTIAARGRSDWDPALACAEPAARDTTFRIVKFILGYTGTKWIVNHAVDGGVVAKSQFTQTVTAGDFKVREIKPLNLLGPVGGIDGAADATGKITLRFRGLDFDSVGGYLLGLAEDPKFTGGRPAFGGLYFLKTQGKGLEHRLLLDANAQAVSGGSSILREVQTLELPGWERVNFKYPLTELFNADKNMAGVYQWKVIAIRDTSAAQFLANGFQPDRYYGESDFGSARGAFAVKGYPKESDFKKLDQQAAPASAQTTAGNFTDRDLDGFPDYMEADYQTNPADKGSFPNFLVDTDRDGIADFLEQMIDAAGIEQEATEAQKTAFFKALIARGVKWTDTDGDGIPDDIEKLLGYNPADAASKPATRARVSAPSGVYSGLIKLGDISYTLKFKVRAQQDTLLVSYSAYFKDTLTDTVAASLNESMGEFLFPIRLPDNGPDSGKSLLLRGTYDKNRAFLQGTANRITSVPKLSTAFSSGPFVGQYAASGRGEDVSAYLGIQKASPAGTVSTPVISAPATGGTATVPALNAVMSYRKPPSGLGNARMSLRQNGSKLFVLTLKDEFGDEVAVLDSTHSFNQEDGSFDISARMTRTDAAKQYTRRIDLNARLGRGKDSLTDIWVLDGSLTESLDSCRKFDSANPAKCTDKFYRDVPGQFSARVNDGDASVKVFGNGVAGDFAGWLQQDKFGTGLSDGNTGSTTGGNTAVGGAATNPIPPESFAKPYAGTAEKFRNFLALDGIGQGDAFYLTMRGRVMRTVNDTLHVKDGAFPYCGNVQIFPTPIPLLDGATAQEKADFVKDSILATSTKYAVLAIEDDLSTGTPAKVSKARDALGFVRANVFLIETRYVDPTSFVGGKCLDGSILPPIFPLDAGLPAKPTGYEYFRGDLEVLRASLTAAGNRITVVKDGSTVTEVKDINPATLRIDPETRAGMAADLSDPSLGYVLLGQKDKAGTPSLVDGRPAALAK